MPTNRINRAEVIDIVNRMSITAGGRGTTIVSRMPIKASGRTTSLLRNINSMNGFCFFATAVFPPGE